VKFIASIYTGIEAPKPHFFYYWAIGFQKSTLSKLKLINQHFLRAHYKESLRTKAPPPYFYTPCRKPISIFNVTISCNE